MEQPALWSISSRPRRRRFDGDERAAWRWELLGPDGETATVTVRTTGRRLGGVPAHVAETRKTRGRNQIEAILHLATPPEAIEVCEETAEPLWVRRDARLEANGSLDELSEWFSRRRLKLNLHRGKESWFAVASSNRLQAGVGLGAVGLSPEDAAERLQRQVLDRPISAAPHQRGHCDRDQASENAAARLEAAGLRAVWWFTAAPKSHWQLSVFDQDGRFVDAGIGSDRAAAAARVVADRAATKRLGRWERWRKRSDNRQRIRTRGSFLESRPVPHRYMRHARAVLQWLVSNPAVAASMSGTIIYAVVRTSFSTFYRQFGVQPEEVGLSEARMLAQSAVTWGLLILGSLALALVLGLATGSLNSSVSVAGRLSRRGAPLKLRRLDDAVLNIRGSLVEMRREEPLFVPNSGPVSRLRSVGVWPFAFTYALIAATIGLVIFFAVQPKELASRARRGVSVSPGLANIVRNPLGFRAERARITIAGKVDDTLPRSAIFLGDSGGTTVLYDLVTRRTIRVSSSSVVVSTSVGAALGAGHLRKRQYVTDVFSPTLSFELPDGGWSSDTHSTNYLNLWRARGARPQFVAFFNFSDETPAAVVRRFTSLPGLRVLDRQSGTLGKSPATIIEAIAVPAHGQAAFNLLSVEDPAGLVPKFNFFFLRGERVKLLVAGHPGGTVMATVEALSVDYAEFDRRAQRLLDSVRIG